MSYTNNKIIKYLSRTSTRQDTSKSTTSRYFYYLYYQVRYSDHYLFFKKPKNQIQVVRKASGVFIKYPWETEYTRYSEREGFYILRRFLGRKERELKTDGKRYILGRKHKDLFRESKRYQIYLDSLKGLSEDEIKNQRDFL